MQVGVAEVAPARDMIAQGVRDHERHASLVKSAVAAERRPHRREIVLDLRLAKHGRRIGTDNQVADSVRRQLEHSHRRLAIEYGFDTLEPCHGGPRARPVLRPYVDPGD